MPRRRKKDSTGPKPEGKTRRSLAAKFLWWCLLGGVLSLCVALISIAGVFFYVGRDLPKISSLKDYRPPIITTVYSDDNRKIAEFYKERRIVVKLSKIPKRLIEAFISAEDARFYKHKGIDLISIVRAFFKNLEAGAIVQGGSTITQQVTKSFFLTPEKSYIRKIKEAILAYRLDRSFTKEEILFLYLNQIYLGHGAYGVEAASENYFGKSITELNIAECAMLAGLPQAPSRYSPFRFPERAKERQIYTLNRMVAEGYITNIEATEAINTKLDIKPRRNWYLEEVPVYTEHIRRYIEKKYGSDALYRNGMKIYTAVNIEMQKAARTEVEKGLYDLDKRQGYRGPVKRLAQEEVESFSKAQQVDMVNSPLEEGKIVKGVVIEVNDTDDTVTVRMGKTIGTIGLADMKWARKPDPKVAYYEAAVRHPGKVLTVGDVIQVRGKTKPEKTDRWALTLEQTPKVQAAMLCMEADTGHVKVMIGGRDFKASQFNRAIQSRRQPGSAFKPIIYAAAIDKGFTPASVMLDTAVVHPDTGRDFKWKPKNYDKKFHGPTLLRDALAKSINSITIKIVKDIGLDYVIAYARKLGITSNLNRNLSLALGSSGLSLLELVRAYSAFANQGYLNRPIFITKIMDREENVIEESNPIREKVIEKSTAYIVTNLLQSVVKNGTGRRVRALNRPVAGKTGTTNNLFDAWFVGYTPRYITGTWVGFDEEASLGKSETGSRAASPIWLGFMKAVLADKPTRLFEVPEGVVFQRIDADTGLLPIAESRKTIFECFKEGTVPTETTPKPGAITDAEKFYKSGF